MEVAKSETRRAQALDVQLEAYRNKLKELPELKEKVARLEQQHKVRSTNRKQPLSSC